jgi:hypothetical protein
MPVSLLEHQHEDRGEDQDAKFAIRRGAERCGLGTHELAVGDRSRPVSGPNRSRRGLGSAAEVRIPGPEVVTAGRLGHLAHPSPTVSIGPCSSRVQLRGGALLRRCLAMIRPPTSPLAWGARRHGRGRCGRIASVSRHLRRRRAVVVAVCGVDCWPGSRLRRPRSATRRQSSDIKDKHHNDADRTITYRTIPIGAVR